MEGILNEYTQTVHRHETEAGTLRTSCGASYNLSPDQLRQVTVDQAAAEHDAEKCGRCFKEGGGY